MKEFNYTITDTDGIHARPAGLLVKEAGKFQSEIIIQNSGKSGDAKRIFSLMTLGVKCGDTITVIAKGEDEEAAAEALEKFLRENL